LTFSKIDDRDQRINQEPKTDSRTFFFQKGLRQSSSSMIYILFPIGISSRTVSALGKAR